MTEDSDVGGEVSSPPFPALTTNTSQLYRHLAVLRAWTIEQQEDLKTILMDLAAAERAAGNDKAAAAIAVSAKQLDREPERLWPESVWGNVSVADHFWVFTAVRSVRATWDAVLRDHEDSWDTKLAIRRRFSVVSASLQVLAEAFVSPEVREMRAEKEAVAFNKRRKSLEKHLRALASVEEPEDEEAGKVAEDDDAGAWFS